MAVCEETNRSDVLDEAAVKKLTGTECITSRELYKDYVTFSAQQLVRVLSKI
jgi:phage/plasmid-associated DNA primase